MGALLCLVNLLKNAPFFSEGILIVLILSESPASSHAALISRYQQPRSDQRTELTTLSYLTPLQGWKHRDSLSKSHGHLGYKVEQCRTDNHTNEGDYLGWWSCTIQDYGNQITPLHQQGLIGLPFRTRTKTVSHQTALGPRLLPICSNAFSKAYITHLKMHLHIWVSSHSIRIYSTTINLYCLAVLGMTTCHII